MSLRFNPPPNWPQPPAGWSPPPGWQPDPSWGPAPQGWPLWVEDTAGATGYGYGSVPPVQAPQGRAAWGPTATGPAKKKKRKWPIVVGIVVGLFVIGQVAGGGDDSSDDSSDAAPAAAVEAAAPSSSATKVPPAAKPSAKPSAQATQSASPKAEPAQEVAPVGPQAQQDFLEQIELSSAKYDDASTELKKSKVVSDRDEALAGITGGEFSQWTGEITTIGANNDGHAHVTVKVGGDVELATWNNAFSDIGDDTLIQSGSPLWDTLIEMDEGTPVKISGEFVRGDGVGVKTSNLTDVFGASSPDFIVRFTGITVDQSAQ